MAISALALQFEDGSVVPRKACTHAPLRRQSTFGQKGVHDLTATMPWCRFVHRRKVTQRGSAAHRQRDVEGAGGGEIDLGVDPRGGSSNSSKQKHQHEAEVEEQAGEQEVPNHGEVVEV